jgi:hypothetical protein
MSHSQKNPPQTDQLQSPPPQPDSPQTELKHLPPVLHFPFKLLLGVGAALAILVPVLSGVKEAVPMFNDFVVSRQMQTLKGTVKSPTDGAQVEAKVNFAGTVTALPAKSSLWLVLYGTGVKKYYPYEIPDSPNPLVWQLPDIDIGLPTDYEKPFTAALYILNAAETEKYRQVVAESWRGRRRGERSDRSADQAQRPKFDRGLPTQPPGKLLQALNLERSPKK